MCGCYLLVLCNVFFFFLYKNTLWSQKFAHCNVKGRVYDWVSCIYPRCGYRSRLWCKTAYNIQKSSRKRVSDLFDETIGIDQGLVFVSGMFL